MRELEKLLKDLDLAIAKIKDIDCKVKAKVKSAILEGKKLDRVTSKALMTKIPDTSETTIERLLNIQKQVVEGLQFKAYNLSAPSVWVDDPEMYAHLKPAKCFRAEDAKLPVQLIAPRMAKLAEATGKEETQEGSIKNKINKFSKNLPFFLENVDGELRRVLVPFVPATFYANYATHVAKQLYMFPPVVQELKDRIHGSFPMTRDALSGLTHAKGASGWAVTAYKDAQLVRLDLVSLSGVYCVNSIELVWDVLVTLPFKNVPEMGRAHAAARFCFPVEHTLSYLLENFGAQ
ncbi:hypothetical protein DSO57_1039636 [Entomophthora muscae]|uniref:Uncharacterized protein n=1 Tax=Entomophthora muscae TaxID=34485 RepID=A0ACC2RSU3_9FUNG|nr:hypothetical protein DSO57_1039636 [Entomophthora muscae]